MSKLIYLASPFSHKDKGIQKLRWALVSYVGAQLVNEGHHIFGPITESYTYTQFGVDGSEWEFWEAHDKLMLKKCDELWIVMIKGWETSVGVGAEMDYANANNMPIKYIDPELYVTIEELFG